MKTRATKWLVLRYLALSLFAQKRALRLVSKHTGIACSTDYITELQRSFRPSNVTHLHSRKVM